MENYIKTRKVLFEDKKAKLFIAKAVIKNPTNYYQLVPEKVVDKLLELEEPMRYIPGFNVDNLKEIISLICYHIRKNEENWVHLKIEYLRRYVPNAELYLKELVDFGVVESSYSYQVGVTAKKYRFTSEYESKYKSFEVTDPKLIRRINKAQLIFKKRNSKKYPNQNKYISALTIQPEVYKYVEQTYTYDLNRFNYAYSSATRIINGDIKYTVDDTSGRYHSNLTNMPKDLRQFVRINGVPLKNIDIKNSQPYLSILILTNPALIAKHAKYVPLKRLLENLQVTETNDIKKYIDLVVKGLLYEYLLEEFQKRGLKYTTREEVKGQVLKILFDRNSHNPQSRRIFAELFPEVHRIFCLVRGYERGDKFRSYQRFAILLQRIESHLILKIILPRINNEHPEIIAVTIHDSIMTGIYTDHVQIVHRIMEEELHKFLGNKPTLKIE